jgi:hypothetical protein
VSHVYEPFVVTAQVLTQHAVSFIGRTGLDVTETTGGHVTGEEPTFEAVDLPHDIVHVAMAVEVVVDTDLGLSLLGCVDCLCMSVDERYEEDGKMG